MSDTKNNGGPAFPMHGRVGDTTVVHQHGMTLRDYFAGQALVSIISSNVRVLDPVEKNAAEAAYRIADAMLKAREQ